jgi:hypothetical protein
MQRAVLRFGAHRVLSAGTDALKTDFTRTGRRTVAGMLQDGMNSAARYYKNNLADGFRQDGMDLLLGAFAITPHPMGAPPPLPTSARRGLAVSTPSALHARPLSHQIPLTVFLALAMAGASLLLVADGGLRLAYVCFWLLAVLASIKVGAGSENMCARAKTSLFLFLDATSCSFRACARLPSGARPIGDDGCH